MGRLLLVGYARVSTVDQDTASQVVALRAAGVTRIFQEQASGVCTRSELERLLYLLRSGDCLVVYRVDRLARSLADLLRVLARVESLGASFRSLSEPIDTVTPAGRLMVQLLGSFAEFERSVIRERCAQGRRAARARGVRFGRPPVIDVAALPGLVAAGLTAGEIATVFGVDRSSVSHCLRKHGLNPRARLLGH